jgi:Uma2 family endonuclease
MSTTATPTRMTVSEYMNYRAPSGFRDELIDGELILSPSAGTYHADLCSALTDLLKPLLRRTDFIVRQDTTVRARQNEPEECGNWPRPDVFVIDKARWIAAAGGHPFGSPQFAIEVLSPSNTAPELQKKIDLYLSTGSVATWIVAGDSSTVVVHDHSGVRKYSLGARVPLPAPLPPKAILVDKIFAGILR